MISICYSIPFFPPQCPHTAFPSPSPHLSVSPLFPPSRSPLVFQSSQGGGLSRRVITEGGLCGAKPGERGEQRSKTESWSHVEKEKPWGRRKRDGQRSHKNNMVRIQKKDSFWESKNIKDFRDMK